MREDEIALLARIRLSQEVKVGDGLAGQVIQGRVGLREALRDQLPVEVVRKDEHRDTSGYDSVLRWHSRT